MKTFLACVAKKYTREPLSEVIEVKALDIYHAVRVVEKATGIKIDGSTNYLDAVELEG